MPVVAQLASLGLTQHTSLRVCMGSVHGDPLVAIEMIHSDQLAAEAYVRGAVVLFDLPSTRFSGKGTELVLGTCFVTPARIRRR